MQALLILCAMLPVSNGARGRGRKRVRIPHTLFLYFSGVLHNLEPCFPFNQGRNGVAVSSAATTAEASSATETSAVTTTTVASSGGQVPNPELVMILPVSFPSGFYRNVSKKSLI